MINPKIKICGISDVEILKQLINLNLDYVGFIFYSKSPRFVDEVFLEKIQNIDFKETRPVCVYVCLLYTSPSPRDGLLSRMPSSA